MGAGSLALIVWLSDAEVDFVLAEVSGDVHAGKRITIDYLRREILAARKLGYTKMLNTIGEGIGAIGVPLRDAQGTVVASLAISSVEKRISSREALLTDAMRKEAAHFTDILRQYGGATAANS